eukprot:COSAG01_NODE_2890_length_6906_cov_23.470545_3_plen_77_part_00
MAGTAHHSGIIISCRAATCSVLAVFVTPPIRARFVWSGCVSCVAVGEILSDRGAQATPHLDGKHVVFGRVTKVRNT